MTESQRIVANWRERLMQQGWPEDAIKRCISDLCEAGYRQCVEDIQARQEEKERIIANARLGFPTMDTAKAVLN